MSGTIIAMVVFILVVASQFGLFYYAMNKGINVGQPEGEGFAPGWVVRCLKCNRTVDAGKAGLIRIKAVGNSNRRGWCDGCHQKVWLRVEPEPEISRDGGKVIRCTECGNTKNARECGLIRLGDTEDGGFRGDCAKCGKKVWLSVEEPSSSITEQGASLPAHHSSP